MEDPQAARESSPAAAGLSFPDVDVKNKPSRGTRPQPPQKASSVAPLRRSPLSKAAREVGGEGSSGRRNRPPTFEFERIADALPELISYVDSDRRYQFNNRAYENWFGISRESLKGRLFEKIIGPAAYRKVKPYVDKALAGQYVTFEGNLTYPSAGDRYVRIDYVPVSDASGRVLGFYGLIIDLTQAREAAILAERNRVARDVHDSAAQTLSGIVMHLECAEEACNPRQEEVLLHIRRTCELARLTVRELRRSLLSLAGSQIEAKDLTESIRGLVGQFQGDTPIRLDFSVSGSPRRLDAIVEENLFYIAHQAISNAIQHSRADCMRMSLVFRERDVRLQAIDDGRGFKASAPSSGFGLASMRERGRQLGGAFKLTSRPGKGTRIEVGVPLTGKPSAGPTLKKPGAAGSSIPAVPLSPVE